MGLRPVRPSAGAVIIELGREIAGFFTKAAVLAFALFVLIVVVYYPRDTDEPLSQAEKLTTERYYANAYENPADDKEDPRYVQIAEAAARQFRIREAVAEFVAKYHLAGKRVLDVGASRCYLQDMVEDYTALDIAVTARRYCRKRFVLGSATAMPFGDSEFDAVWSIWVLEHVPNPEQALCEIRRVVRPGGVVYLRPAWLCTPFAAQGCSVRPYSDFNWRGKITKATMPWRRAVQRFTLPVVRVARHVSWALSGGPSRLRDVRLTPNYEHYWEPDSDAVNSLDPFEVALWFRSRGDRCLSCPEGRAAYFEFPDALILQIQKQK